MSREHKDSPKTTAKGTKLPIIDLRGKPYLQVAHRIVWMREEHPDWRIATSIVDRGDGWIIFLAKILDASGNLIANAHKSETKKNFADYLEKGETGAIGRALALCGYGTQFEPEFDEGERLADAPVAVAKKEDPRQNPTANGKESKGRKTVADCIPGILAAFGKLNIERDRLEGLIGSKLEVMSQENVRFLFTILKKIESGTAPEMFFGSGEPRSTSSDDLNAEYS